MYYNDYRDQPASEKVVLAILNGSKRLAGWSLYSGSIYKLKNIESSVVVSITENGTALIAVGDVGSITAGKYYFDRITKTIYLQSSDSQNPNVHYIVCTIKFWFSNNPIILPNDLNTGFAVEYLPLISKTSSYKVEIDNQIDQLGQMIEGSGSIQFTNDKDFWASRFERITWENNSIVIYSFNRWLASSEAKVIFKGSIQEKKWGLDLVEFSLKDQLNVLRGTIDLPSLGAVSGAKIPFNEYSTKQRLVYGENHGFRPQNIDQIISTGYDTGVTVSTGSVNVLTVSNTFDCIRKNDEIILDDGTERLGQFSVSSVTSQTTFTINRNLSSYEESRISLSGLFKVFIIRTSSSKSFTNRRFKISYHAIREAKHQILGVSAPGVLRLSSIDDFEVGSLLEYNGGLTRVRNIIGTDKVRITDPLNQSPAAGDYIKRVSVTDVRINDLELTYLRDYDYDADNGEITLENTAEFNIAPVRVLSGTINYQASSRTITGTNTAFTTELTQESYIEISSTVGLTTPIYVRVIQINSDTEIIIDTNAASTVSLTSVRYKRVLNYTHNQDILSITTMGATDDGAKTGNNIKTVPQIVKDVLTKAGLSASINLTSFTAADEFAPYQVATCYPSNFSERTAPTFRGVINEVNRSVFGVLFQNNDFEFEYTVLRPNKLIGIDVFSERDIIGFSVSSDSADIVKKVTLGYNRKEYNYETTIESFDEINVESNRGKFLIKTDKEFEIKTVLHNEDDATMMANRWSYLLSYSRGSLEINTKLQAVLLSVTDSIEIDHRFIYKQLGFSLQRQAAQVMASRKNGYDVSINAENLSSTYATTAIISEDDSVSYGTALESQLVYYGFITDNFGLLNNEQETIDLNLIW